MVKVEKKLAEMGLELPKVPMDMETWARCKRAGNFIFMGTTAAWTYINKGEHEKLKGAIGRERTVEEAKDIAKDCALSMLSALKNELGDLDKVDAIVKLEVYLYGVGQYDIPDPNNPYPGYGPVADAASELFIKLYGEKGRATRTMTPFNGITDITCELDLVVYVKD